MQEQFLRTALMIGWEKIELLSNMCVAVFGIGGVGGSCAEALARVGIGRIDLFDHDKVSRTNINRQIIATNKTVGLYKVDVMRDRILEINPNARAEANKIFYLPENADEIDLTIYDYIIDAVDNITAKLELAYRANLYGIPIISSMGTGNKLDPTKFTVADIYDTSVCPVARVMRRELKKRGISALKVVYSVEPPIKQKQAAVPISGAMPALNAEPASAAKPNQSTNIRGYDYMNNDFADCSLSTGCADSTQDIDPTTGGKGMRVPASIAFVPPVVGFILAGEVVRDLAEI